MKNKAVNYVLVYYGAVGVLSVKLFDILRNFFGVKFGSYLFFVILLIPIFYLIFMKFKKRKDPS